MTPCISEKSSQNSERGIAERSVGVCGLRPENAFTAEANSTDEVREIVRDELSGGYGLKGEMTKCSSRNLMTVWSPGLQIGALQEDKEKGASLFLSEKLLGGVREVFSTAKTREKGCS